jgi:hypothetical protein
MNGVWSTRGGDEKFVPKFSQKAWKEMITCGNYIVDDRIM